MQMFMFVLKKPTMDYDEEGGGGDTNENPFHAFHMYPSLSTLILHYHRQHNAICFFTVNLFQWWLGNSTVHSSFCKEVENLCLASLP